MRKNVLQHFVRESEHLIRGGGGGVIAIQAVSDARESPSEKHPKRSFNVIPKDTL